MTRVLIAEDEGRIASFLEKGLQASGFATTVASDGEEALELALSGKYDLLVLDVGMPHMSGLEILRELRLSDVALPVIMLTARDSIREMVEGLEGGADDYVSKPFRFDELLARIRVQLRGERVTDPAVLRVGDAALDRLTRQVVVAGTAFDLSAREYALADALFRQAGDVITREQLLSRVWGYDTDPGSNIVDVYIGYLRKKLGKERIESVRGVGYRLVAAERPEAD